MESVHDTGVFTNEESAIFQNAGYMGLYGGLDVDDIHERKQKIIKGKVVVAKNAPTTLHRTGYTDLSKNTYRRHYEHIRQHSLVYFWWVIQRYSLAAGGADLVHHDHRDSDRLAVL